MATIQYTSRLASTAADGVLVEAVYMKDETQGKLQSTINAELYAGLEAALGNSTIYRPKGSVETYAALPDNATAGDVYNVIGKTVLEDGTEYAAGTNFVYTEDGTWDSLGGSVDISEAKTYADGKLTEAKSYTDSKLQEFKTGDFATYKTEAADALKAVSDKVDVINGTGTGSLSQTLSDAKSYTDTQVSSGDSATLESAKSYTDEKLSDVLTWIEDEDLTGDGE